MVNLKDPYFETNGEENDKFLLEFEKFVSAQDVSFFSQKMDISKLFCNLILYQYNVR